MCGERNIAETPVICVYANRLRRQYYCFSCWLIVSDRAAVDIPELKKKSSGDVQMIGLLLGIKSAKKAQRIEGNEALEIASDGSVLSNPNMHVSIRRSLIIDNIPFKRYHLTGDELAAQSAKVRGSLGNAD